MNYRKICVPFLAAAVIFSICGCKTEIREEEITDYETADSTDGLIQYSFAKQYEETAKGKGFTDVDVLKDEPEWGRNHTHLEDLSIDRSVDFIWESPLELGNACFYRKKQPVQFVLRDSANRWKQQLTVFYAGKNEETEAASCADEGSCEVSETSYSTACTFAVENKKEKGYERILILKEDGSCYHFSYLEKLEYYDDDRARRIINSINFWNYIPA